MAAIIQVENVTKTYRVGKVDVPAVRGVSLDVERGDFISLVGPSGSGKSTLFYILGGLAKADSGRVLIDGTDFAHTSDSERTLLRRKKIGFVFQKFNLLPTLTARENIRIALDIAGRAANGDAQYFRDITQLLGIDKRLDHRPSELSGGEQQRVALARALINKPVIVLVFVMANWCRRTWIRSGPERFTNTSHSRKRAPQPPPECLAGLTGPYAFTKMKGPSGSNSVVECDLAKVEVAGSNPVSRSSMLRPSPSARVSLRCSPRPPPGRPFQEAR